MKSNFVKDLGMIGLNKNGTPYRMFLVKCDRCDVEWETRASMWKIRKGNHCKPCSKKTHGSSSKSNVLYRRWVGMRERCRLSYRGSSYHGTSICKEWENFASFEQWALSNGFSKELELDKDILCDKLGIYPKIYSPDTCIWVTKSENTSYAYEALRNSGKKRKTNG